jgi:hypothetical protein
MTPENYFPNLIGTDYQITSPVSSIYNCIAWAVDDSSRWWWPDALELAYWPLGVPREETLSSFVSLIEQIGFERCADASLEAGFEKIALYADGDRPTHAARQLETGAWTSKLGPLEDIEHSLNGLVGEHYGAVTSIFKRSRRPQLPE